jgi:hypothetical protein
MDEKLPEGLESVAQELEKRKSESERREQEKIERRKEGRAFGIAVLALVMSSGSLGIAAWQGYEARKARLDAAPRPWIGMLGSIRVSNRPTVVFTRAGPASLEGVEVNLEGIYEIKNFGTAPAFRVNTLTTIGIPRPGETTKRPSVMEFECPDWATNSGEGDVLFQGGPGTLVPFEAGAQVFKGNITEIRRIWLLGCISYQDAVGQLHRTRFWLRSTFPEGSPWIASGDGHRYMPIAGFESWGQESD